MLLLAPTTVTGLPAGPGLPPEPALCFLAALSTLCSARCVGDGFQPRRGAGVLLFARLPVSSAAFRQPASVCTGLHVSSAARKKSLGHFVSLPGKV